MIIFKLKKVWAIFSFALGLVALYMMFIFAPTEMHMGDVQRIMYAHVSSAWIAYLAWGVVALSGLLYLWKKSIIFDQIAQASAEIGILFMTILLLTGSMWGRAVWNTWWVWDPRLTTALILWFVYVGYLLIRSTNLEFGFKRIVAAMYGIIGLVNIPLIHFSVKWWRSIHPNTMTREQINMPPEMITTLFVSAIFFVSLYVLLLLYRVTIINYQHCIYQLKEQIYNKTS